ncbi:MAG: biopolymer transporter ExbD [Candidatus Omnitrophica bacterium]|nr:biopolymer transporter ExbD [Candidatus Omnitrophota bacterium]MBU4346478.1 biopolymer transporter ExbD [Candidatus Omnitrophota bacterium]MBU4472629.1 biopolymer transporter ExbD [Candidatus Omnitrophota bacterium]MCG2706746.1 biopolymer transporter ExbD [Candidatus Omnitrophota bacterium]
MRFKHRMELEHGLKQIDIAPLIDVVFQLLIFFMLTSSFVMQPSIKVNLPKAVTSKVVQDKNIEIIISSENVTYLNGRVVTTEELKALLRQVAKRNQPILIKADRRASLGRVVEMWDMCRDLGITQINIATNQE